jgi:hypothetical protein
MRTTEEQVKKIIFVMPYFGRWPEWFFLFLESCKFNSSIEWIFFTDCGQPAAAPSNVRFVHMTFAEMRELASNKLGRPVNLSNPYKICDLRLCYGKIFEEYLREYDFWGFGDIDVIYGNLSGILQGEVLSNDIISFHKDHLSGHLCLFRNSESVRTLYTRIKNFGDALDAKEYLIFDELLFPNGIPWSKQQKYMDAGSLNGLKTHGFEVFSTPFSLAKPWTDGTFRFPSEWTWKDGRLNNDLDVGRDFPYLHFMQWKTGGGTLVASGKRTWLELDRLVYVDPAHLNKGFRINCYGFHPAEKNTPRPDFVDSQWKLFFRRAGDMLKFYTSRSNWSFIPMYLGRKDRRPVGIGSSG